MLIAQENVYVADIKINLIVITKIYNMNTIYKWVIKIKLS